MGQEFRKNEAEQIWLMTSHPVAGVEMAKDWSSEALSLSPCSPRALHGVSPRGLVWGPSQMDCLHGSWLPPKLVAEENTLEVPGIFITSRRK